MSGGRTDTRRFDPPPNPLPTQGRVSRPPICNDASIDAITRLRDGTTHVFKGKWLISTAVKKYTFF